MKNRTLRSRARALAPLALLAVPLATLAQSVPTLREVVVTANRMDTPMTEVIADVTTIDRAALERAGPSSLREVLGQQPGVQWSSNGSYRSSTGIYLRGAAAAQTIYLIDGIRVGSVTSGGAALENMALDRIERIEILRGAASALYGPDAVGGVVQIFTRVPSQELQASVSLGAGTDGQQKAGLSLSAGSGMFAYSFGISQEKASGISSNNNPASSGYNADADGFEASSWDAKLVAQLAPLHTLTLSTLQSRTTYMYDGLPTNGNPLKLTKATSDARNTPVLDDVALTWEAQWAPDWKSTVALGTSLEQSVYNFYRIADGAYGGSDKFNTQRQQAQWQNDFQRGTDRISAVLEQRSESVDAYTRYAVTQRDITGAMLSYGWNRAGWNALAVVRNDQNSQFGNFSNWALSGGLLVAEGLRTVASLGTSFKAPTFNELYYPGFGNTALTPQRNRASELGLKYDLGALSWSAIGYYNEIQGYVIPSTNEQKDRAVLRGVTLAAKVDADATSYTASYDYTDPRSYPDDLRLVRIAQNFVKAGVQHRIDAVELFAETLLSDTREDKKVVGSGRETLPGYAVWNMGASWKVRRDVKLQARLNNLTDTQFMLANGYSMPGRNLFISMVWSH